MTRKTKRIRNKITLIKKRENKKTKKTKKTRKTRKK
jgi:hypothetical protein